MTATDGWDEDFVEVAGLKLQVLRAGSGPSLLVLPDDVGVAGFLPFYRELAATHSLTLLSPPGFGRSARPTWAREIHDLAALNQLALDALGLRGAPVLAFGFGGWLAAEMEVHAPATFSRMALVSPFGLKPPEGEIYDQFLGQGITYVRAGFHDPRVFLETYAPGGEAEIDLDFREQWEVNREMTARVAWAPLLFRNQLPHLLPALRLPVLVAWGTDDRINPPSSAARWQSLIPGARLHLISDCGHYPDIEQPEALRRALAGFFTGSKS